MPGLTLYNSLSRSFEPFAPQDGKTVKFYACGPTVYARQHIGNLRSYIVEDVLKRTLLMNGYAVKHIMNITDVGHLTSDADTGEDKMEAAAKSSGKMARDIAKEITEQFFADAKKVLIVPPDIAPKATEHIDAQIALVQTLEQKGYTYATSDGVYFDTSKFPDYGKISAMTKEGLREGARVEKNSEKRNSTDFALWKFSPKDEQRQMEWKSPWGMGFPGWHIECSAMAMKYLGETLDIHAGGIDHRETHHPNEIAQSEVATGKSFARFWFHVEFLNLKDSRHTETVERAGKMSKSLGNAITLDDVIAKGFDPLAFRYLCLTTHYRKPIAFSWDALEAAQNALDGLRAFAERLPETGDVVLVKIEEKFRDAMNDDLNSPRALAVLWEMVRGKDSPASQRATLATFDAVLGLGLNDVRMVDIPEEVRMLVAERETARKDKDYLGADAVRLKIDDAGYNVDDTPTGPRITKK